MMDYALPYLVQVTRTYCDKVDKLEQSMADTKETQADLNSLNQPTLGGDMSSMMTGMGGQLMLGGPAMPLMGGMGGMPNMGMGGGMGGMPNMGMGGGMGGGYGGY